MKLCMLTARQQSYPDQRTPEDHLKISTRGKGHMKLILTGLVALCTVAATFADEAKFGPGWVEGHNYKVVDGQLVDLGPAPAPASTSASMPSPTPAQPT